MFERFLSTIEYNDNLKLYLIVTCLIYLLCFGNLLPKKFSSVLNKTIVKSSLIAYILYVSKFNLGGAILLTIVYLIVSKCIKSKDVKEGMEDQDIKSYVLELNKAISDSFNDANNNNLNINIDPTVMDQSYDKILNDVMKKYSNNENSSNRLELTTDAEKENYLSKFMCPSTPSEADAISNGLNVLNRDKSIAMLYTDRVGFGHSNQCCMKGKIIGTPNDIKYSASECNTCVDSCVNKSCKQTKDGNGNDITKCQTGINDCDPNECDKTADSWGHDTDRKNACRAACNRIYNKTFKDKNGKVGGYVAIDEDLPSVDKDEIINGIDKSIVDPSNPDVITNAHEEFSKNLMRSIGCNRIRPDTASHAYYSPIDKKCINISN
jgi:hypothetical protein